MRLHCLMLFLLVGCVAPTRNDRRLNHQIVGAGEFILENATQPDIQQAGKDVLENATLLQRRLDLEPEPEDKKPYSPEESKQARDDARAEIPWWQWAVGTFVTLLMGGWGVQAVGRFLPAALGPAGNALNLLISGFAKARAQAEGNGGKLDIGEVFKTMIREQNRHPEIRALIRRLSDRTESRLGLDLKTKLE